MKKLGYKALTERNKDDVELLIAQRDLWFDVDIELDVDQAEDWKQYDDAIYKLEKIENKMQLVEVDKKMAVLESQKKKTEVKMYKNDEDQKLYDMHYGRFMSMVEDGYEMYYVAPADKYHFYDKNKAKWLSAIKIEAAKMSLNINGPIDLRAFKDVIRDTGGIKSEITSTFNKVDVDVLNTMRTDHWLKPKDGDVHVMFDILLRSVGGHKKESMDHLEQWMYWKYSNPQDFKLPALVLYGVGGAGKNRFSEWVPSVIFGEKQVEQTTTKQAFGDFNSVMGGRTIVMVDEAERLYDYRSMIKANINNRKVTINEKHEKAYKADVTAGIIIAGNSDPSSALLDGTPVDRRFSMVKSVLDIYETTQIVLNELKNDNDASATLEEAKAFYDANESVFNDSEEVSKWLGHIVSRWSFLDAHPEPLRDELYNKAIDDTKPIIEMVFEGVFINRPFTHITLTDLYQMYLIVLEDYNQSQKNKPLGKIQFRKRCEDWLSSTFDDQISYGQKDIFEGITKTRVSTMGFYPENSGRLVDNRSDYISEAKRLDSGELLKPSLKFDIETVVAINGTVDHYDDSHELEIFDYDVA